MDPDTKAMIAEMYKVESIEDTDDVWVPATNGDLVFLITSMHRLRGEAAASGWEGIEVQPPKEHMSAHEMARRQAQAEISDCILNPDTWRRDGRFMIRFSDHQLLLLGLTQRMAQEYANRPRASDCDMKDAPKGGA